MTYTKESLQGDEQSKEMMNLATKGIVIAAAVVIAVLSFALAK